MDKPTPVSELVELVKRNAVIEHDSDDGLLQHFVEAALSYAAGYQHIPPNTYETSGMSDATKQAVVLLATHMYESRDASTAGVFANSAGAAEQTWRAIHRLLVLDRDWKI